MVITEGVALVRLSHSPLGVSGRKDGIEEFYSVLFGGEFLPERYTTYDSAFLHCEKLWKESCEQVASIAND